MGSPSSAIVPSWYGNVSNSIDSPGVVATGDVTGVNIDCASVGSVIAGGTSNWPEGTFVAYIVPIDPDIPTMLTASTSMIEGAYAPYAGNLDANGEYLVLFMAMTSQMVVLCSGWYNGDSYVVEGENYLLNGFDDAIAVAGNATGIDFDFENFAGADGVQVFPALAEPSNIWPFYVVFTPEVTETSKASVLKAETRAESSKAKVVFNKRLSAMALLANSRYGRQVGAKARMIPINDTVPGYFDTHTRRYKTLGAKSNLRAPAGRRYAHARANIRLSSPGWTTRTGYYTFGYCIRGPAAAKTMGSRANIRNTVTRRLG